VDQQGQRKETKNGIVRIFPKYNIPITLYSIHNVTVIIIIITIMINIS